MGKEIPLYIDGKKAGTVKSVNRIDAIGEIPELIIKVSLDEMAKSVIEKMLEIGESPLCSMGIGTERKEKNVREIAETP